MNRTHRTPAGVTEMQYRKALGKIRQRDNLTASTVDAAALQAEMSKRFSLNPTSRSRRALTGHMIIQNRSQSNITSNPNITCDCCQTQNSSMEDICRACGYFLRSLLPTEPTLAQRRGLVPLPPKPDAMSLFEWEVIERSVMRKSDPDSTCPICMEHFSHGEEVLLSCSHIFHKNCLKSFETFMKNGEVSCPICRSLHFYLKYLSTNDLLDSFYKLGQKITRKN